MKNKVSNEKAPEYITILNDAEDQKIVDKAMEILRVRMAQNKAEFQIGCPSDTIDFLKLKLAEKEHEVFSAIFLNNRHGVIHYEEMFRGTIDSSSVYPREVAKTALAVNAAAVIFCHNHPSGVAEPSQSDINITKVLRDGLKLFEIRVLDHIIIGGITHCSLAERGEI